MTVRHEDQQTKNYMKVRRALQPTRPPTFLLLRLHTTTGLRPFPIITTTIFRPQPPSYITTTHLRPSASTIYPPPPPEAPAHAPPPLDDLRAPPPSSAGACPLNPTPSFTSPLSTTGTPPPPDMASSSSQAHKWARIQDTSQQGNATAQDQPDAPPPQPLHAYPLLIFAQAGCPRAVAAATASMLEAASGRPEGAVRRAHLGVLLDVSVAPRRLDDSDGRLVQPKRIRTPHVHQPICLANWAVYRGRGVSPYLYREPPHSDHTGGRLQHHSTTAYGVVADHRRRGLAPELPHVLDPQPGVPLSTPHHHVHDHQSPPEHREGLRARPFHSISDSTFPSLISSL
ncbi:hypothetical protein L1987_57749 [Smallanthus sonchifolius]|uniref:Uncharacterized protein n=1 Tax=Smallanthus sonchifolius TaxID=185202 RepID=A0ACB9DDP8_9ASTR|nr:hypothetical protein L1987_57749 [Smallanthus sonchifolius]